MTLDEQLRALCEEHDLASLSIDTMRGHGRTWHHIGVQWLDDQSDTGRSIATSDHGVSVREGIAQAIERMNAKRAKPADVPELEAA